MWVVHDEILHMDGIRTGRGSINLCAFSEQIVLECTMSHTPYAFEHAFFSFDIFLKASFTNVRLML